MTQTDICRVQSWERRGWGDRNAFKIGWSKYKDTNAVMINCEAACQVFLYVWRLHGRTFLYSCMYKWARVHPLYLRFGKSPVSVKFRSRWSPVKIVWLSLFSLYWEMCPLGWDGSSQYSSTADVFITRCLGFDHTPGV